ncbi:ParB N-terminal domain-containing protein [Deinococcus radiotolerans]|uniref:Chromosome 2-partitioning protein ParB n=1 Tax=Deinococcus radiotolerans TaxID=1309407 RepID=A0ABQ2FPF9_9DEIO|nr:ParB/RepB/Spo0J family partition protein [Deinococcus radiotolerans]GGL13628.1 putative chromosome 2-partitioning protein ParB [Deinococcus radiotolerans]
MTRRPRPERRRDLEGLLGTDVPDLTQRALPDRHLPVSQLTVGATQPRRAFDQDALDSLAQSVREHGVLQPILVRPVGQQYEIVAGERRWRAAQLAELQEIPVVIREMDDQEARRLALIENLQRDDLNTLDEVDAKLELVSQVLNVPLAETRTRLMQMLREAPGPDHVALDTLFSTLGEQWTSFARNKLKILKWSPLLLDAVRQGLAYTAAQQIAQVSAEHHPGLIALARTGITRAQLREEIRTLQQRASALTPTHQVARHLASTRWLKSLSAAEQKELDGWLSKMPDSIRNKLNP